VSSRKRIVVADAGVLINLIHVDALQLLGRLVRFEFVLIEHVVQEITRPDQAAALSHAMQQGWIRRESLNRPRWPRGIC
jgi:predicted nucleic acid-binding protein